MLNKSNKLKNEADSLLTEWKLLDFLNRYGDTYVVGSVVLDLMVWRDIDLVILSYKPVIRKAAVEIASHIYGNDRVRKVSIVDERLIENPRKPEGIYIGVEYITDYNDPWKIDIWYLLAEKDKSVAKTKDILSKLSTDTKEKILDIKSQMHDNPNYRKIVTSIDIYEAVLEKGVSDFDEFKHYIQITKNLML